MAMLYDGFVMLAGQDVSQPLATGAVMMSLWHNGIMEVWRNGTISL